MATRWGGAKIILLREMRFQVDRARPYRRAYRHVSGWMRMPGRRAG
jgi:hypothetical protein